MEWKGISGTEEWYSISVQGEIKNEITNKILKPRPHKKGGYMRIGLITNGNSKMYMVHRLVLMAFNPREDAHLFQVNHINMNTADNRLENLEWVTDKQNKIHSCRGRFWSRRKLLEAVLKICNF